ncbi:CU044_5270 family protein [Streptomyces sp. SBT349]|uniref:CU044_5270 family protein n=1 Tax=Streptomyces sp. SBT349 TaxID=1580539 RepID=UPI00066A3472|nr:CU044_5270 family protein [Streptomyces sp. SBT349]
MNGTPSLPDRDLPPGRHRQLKEHLMHEIHKNPEPRGTSADRKKWLLPAIGLPAAAGALALALALLISGAPGGTDAPGRGVGTEAGTEGTSPSATAVQLLDRVALAAVAQAPVEIRDDQYIYVSSLVQQHGGQPQDREVWEAVDGSRQGLLRTEGMGDVPLGGSSFNYRYLQTLPTDPEAMLEWLYGQQEEGDEDHDAHQDAYVHIGDLLQESLVPPDVAAALYGAAALIPGVSVIPDAQDAAGRPGIAVSRTDSYNPDRSHELIFDEESLELLGTRNVALTDLDLEDSGPVAAGDVLYSSAVLDRAVVDEVGARP